MLAINVKFAGYSTDCSALDTFITPSSNGCLKVSIVCLVYSGISSKNKTPLCAMLISPGLELLPPPVSETVVAVWCGALNGLEVIIPSLLSNSPAMLCILVTSNASAKVKSGKIPEKHFASIVLPEPGGPIIKTLWPPAAAISNALLALDCPLTNLKSFGF